MAVVALSIVFTLPVWMGAVLAMTDYPQHLSMASIVRWYHDPSRRLVESYTFALSRPNSAFVLATATLSYLLPLEVAGKLVVAVAVAATGVAGLLLARRAGRPGWYALFALVAVYNFGFFFGFVNFVLAAPLWGFGIVLADTLFDRPLRIVSTAALACLAALFYVVHLQVLFLFVATVVWLALLRRPNLRDLAVVGIAMLPAVCLAAFHFLTRHPDAFRYRERLLYLFQRDTNLLADRLLAIPRHSFGDHPAFGHILVFFVVALAVFCLVKVAIAQTSDDELPLRIRPWSQSVALLRQGRFLAIGASLALAYLFLPGTFIGIYVYHRLLGLVWLVLPAILPRCAIPHQRLPRIALAIGLAGQLLMVSQIAHYLDTEASNGLALVDRTVPGKNLMALIQESPDDISGTSSPFMHLGAYYVARKGGRTAAHFSELHVSPVQLRHGLEWEDLDTEWKEWFSILFRFADYGYHFDYFLFRGDFARLHPIFGRWMSHLDYEVRGDWMLLWRKQEGLAPSPTTNGGLAVAR
jgi:hypothetical protein